MPSYKAECAFTFYGILKREGDQKDVLFPSFFIHFQTAGQLNEQEGSVELLAGAVFPYLDLSLFLLCERMCAAFGPV